MSYKPSQDEQQPDGPVRYLPCRYCGKQTLVETLIQYGARCFSCFESYCAAAGSRHGSVNRDAMSSIGQGGEGGPRAWAYKLRERHQNGERLTRAQVEAYQAVVSDES